MKNLSLKLDIFKITDYLLLKHKIMGFKHKQTGVHFENRKQAVILMGQTRYKQFLSNEEFEWDNEEDK